MWQHGQLQFARHAEFLFDLQILLLQLRGAFREREFGDFPRRDVPRNAEGANDFPGAIAQRHLDRGHPRHGAVRPGFLFFKIHQRLARAHRLLFIRAGLLGVCGAEIIRIGFAHGGGGVGQIKFFGLRAADAQEAALRVLEINRVRNFLHQDFQQMPVAPRDVLTAMAQDGLVDDGTKNGQRQFVREHVILRAKQQRLAGEFLVRWFGDENNRNVQELAVKPGERFKAPIRHGIEIQQDEIDPSLGEPFQRSGNGGRFFAMQTSGGRHFCGSGSDGKDTQGTNTHSIKGCAIP